MRQRRVPVTAVVALFVLGCALSLAATAAPAFADGATWVWPLRPQPHLVRPFEPPAGAYAAGHRGVDLAGSVGHRVLAVADGVVTFVGMVAGKGVVVVDHGTERSTYQPVAGAVARGEQVRAGQVLGRLQLGGSHCWPDACLHLGRVVSGSYLDPLALLGSGPIRLLPLSEPLPPVLPPAASRHYGTPEIAALDSAVLGLRLGMIRAVP